MGSQQIFWHLMGWCGSLHPSLAWQRLRPNRDSLAWHGPDINPQELSTSLEGRKQLAMVIRDINSAVNVANHWDIIISTWQASSITPPSKNVFKVKGGWMGDSLVSLVLRRVSFSRRQEPGKMSIKICHGLFYLPPYSKGVVIIYRWGRCK